MTEEAVNKLKRDLYDAQNLLESALEAIPNYTDGRNDDLCDAIEDWLRDQQAKEQK